MSEKLPPDLIKSINHKQLESLNETVSHSFPDGSPEFRRYQMQIRLLKKLNEKEYKKTLSEKRKNSRFS